MTIYQNNSVTISIERVDEYEAKVNINGQNLMWISRDQQEDFIKELTTVLDNYRI